MRGRRRIGAVLVLLVLGLMAPRAGAQVSGWAGQPDAPAAGSTMGRGKTTVMELFGQLGVQEGVVLGQTGADGRRAPLGVKPLLGFNFFEIKHTRMLLGVTLAFPFSVEMGWGNDVTQFAIAPGVNLSYRVCANWGWFAGVEIPVVVSPERIEGAPTEVLGGVSLRGGAAWYFTTGLGIFAEANLDLYFGDSAAFVMGVTGGVVLSYEMFRYTPAPAVLGGGGS